MHAIDMHESSDGCGTKNVTESKKTYHMGQSASGSFISSLSAIQMLVATLLLKDVTARCVQNAGPHC